jgi:DtxR family Mn-dependent transcriptional regulator
MREGCASPPWWFDRFCDASESVEWRAHIGAEAAMNTADQYLKAIYVLQQTGNSPAPTGDIADRLEVSPASANEMIGKLTERGLVEHEKYNGTVVTEEGEQRAQAAIEAYCVLQRFLHTVLDVDEYKREARAIESVLDTTVVERLDTLIDRQSNCPDCFDGTADKCACLDCTEMDSQEDTLSPSE